MEERLEYALDFANYRQTLNNQLHKVKVRAAGALTVAKNGGTFTINRELICFLDYLSRGGYKDVPLLDDNNNPIQITDIDNFLKEITTRYFDVANDYLKEYQEIKKARNVKSILDLKDI
jgi:hypothetical protein